MVLCGKCPTVKMTARDTYKAKLSSTIVSSKDDSTWKPSEPFKLLGGSGNCAPDNCFITVLLTAGVPVAETATGATNKHHIGVVAN